MEDTHRLTPATPSDSLLRELVAYLRRQRTELREEWVDASPTRSCCG